MRISFPYFGGTLPWQRSLRDVNLSNGNLFKSFTDIQVPPARGAGLAWQRTYNSNEDRVGPFGYGWTDAYDTHMEEAANNHSDRSDFFGARHSYTRDADGLYSPPPYLFDEFSSDYDNFLVNGPPPVLADTEKGMDGTVKHFTTNNGERDLDSITDRHGNQTVLTYGQTVDMGDGTTKNLLTRITDPSGRHLDVTWTNLNTAQQPAWRITEVQGPFDNGGSPIYTVSYEYGADFNLWKVHQDPLGLDRVTTFTYTQVQSEAELLASIADPLGHTVSYQYSLPGTNPTGTLWVTQITEPGSGGNFIWQISPSLNTVGGVSIFAWCGSNLTNYGAQVGVQSDTSLRTISLLTTSTIGNAYTLSYDSANNVTQRDETIRWQTPEVNP